MSRRIAGAPRVVQRASESSCSAIGIRERVFAVAVAVAVTVAVAIVVTVACVLVSLSIAYSYERISPFFPTFTDVCNYHPELSKRVRARVWWKEVSGKLPTWGIGENRAVKVRECADRSMTPLFRSHSTDRLLHRYSCVVNKICPHFPLNL